MTLMFPFLTSQPNPIGGCASGNYFEDEGFRLCSFDCCYCWAKGLKNRFKYEKYQGPWRIIESELKWHYPDEFIWPCDMIDIGDPTIPFDIIIALLTWVKSMPCPVLLLTKNPEFYRKYIQYIPENAILGVTIETDYLIEPYISKAPQSFDRFFYMKLAKAKLPNKRFIAIEPIMKFSRNFHRKISEIEPWAVAVGYDNYGNNLPEHSLETTKELISELEKSTTVYLKTLREANHSSLSKQTSLRKE